MSKIETGGPAFPNPALADANFCPHFDMSGMTLRDYFMAHAPAEPQRWFKPKIAPKPNEPLKLHDMSEQEQEDFAAWDSHVIDVAEIKCPRVQDYAMAMEGYHAAQNEWELMWQKQRHVQWPAAWADEMLKAREAA